MYGIARDDFFYYISAIRDGILLDRLHPAPLILHCGLLFYWNNECFDKAIERVAVSTNKMEITKIDHLCTYWDNVTFCKNCFTPIQN